MRLAPALLPLLLVTPLACRRPQPSPPVPDWSQRVEAAARAHFATRGVKAGEGNAFADFKTGAGMVNDALHLGWVPWHVGRVLETPEGEASGAEVDPDTGLVLGMPMEGGAADGFLWALAERREELARAGLLRPSPVPQLPAPSDWQPWTSDQGQQTWSVPDGQVRVTLQPGLLAWEVIRSGDPPVRGWRPHTGEAPRFLAWSDGALWIELQEGHLAALDPTSGRVRRAEPAPPWPAALLERVRLPGARPERRGSAPLPLPPDDDDDEDTEAADKAIGTLLALAQSGDVPSMVELGWALLEGRMSLSKDPIGARDWFNQAKAAGCTSASLADGFQALKDREARKPR